MILSLNNKELWLYSYVGCVEVSAATFSYQQWGLSAPVSQSHSLTQSAARESRAASPATEATQHTALISHTRRRVRCESDNYWGDIVSVNWGRTVKAGVRRVMWWADNQEAICIHIPGTAARQLCWALPSSSICYLGSKVTTQYLD